MSCFCSIYNLNFNLCTKSLPPLFCYHPFFYVFFFIIFTNHHLAYSLHVTQLYDDKKKWKSCVRWMSRCDNDMRHNTAPAFYFVYYYYYIFIQWSVISFKFLWQFVFFNALNSLMSLQIVSFLFYFMQSLVCRTLNIFFPSCFIFYIFNFVFFCNTRMFLVQKNNNRTTKWY